MSQHPNQANNRSYCLAALGYDSSQPLAFRRSSRWMRWAKTGDNALSDRKSFSHELIFLHKLPRCSVYSCVRSNPTLGSRTSLAVIAHFQRRRVRNRVQNSSSVLKSRVSLLRISFVLRSPVTSYQLPVLSSRPSHTRGKCTRWDVTTSSELELIREILTPRSSEGTLSPNL